FVGVLCGLKRKSDVEFNGKIFRVIVLAVFADGKKIPCILVGECSALMDINSLKKYQRAPVLILESFKIQVNGDKVSLQNVINVSRVSINRDMQETVDFLNGYHIASHDFSRLCSDENGDLVCVIDDESFDWKLMRTIANLKGNNEKIEHPYCPKFFHQLIGKEIVFKVQAKRINSPGYCGTFKIINVISDARFFRKVQSNQCIKDVTSDSGFSPILEDFSQCGQLRSYHNQVVSGVPIELHSVKEMLADILCAKIYSSASRNDQICILIGEIIDVPKHQKWWYYCYLCNAPVSHVGNLFYCYLCKIECFDVIRRYRIKIIVSHSNGSNIFILEDDEVMQILKKSCIDFLMDQVNSSQSTDDYTIPNSMISQLMNKKIVFIVDPRPIGYDLNKSLHVVRAICDDVDIVSFLEDSIHDNQQQKFPLDPFVPHFPFEFKNPVEFHSNATVQCSSSSGAPVHHASPISVLNWNCWTVNHAFHARICSSQGSNLVGNHQPLTIREELRRAFGDCENTSDAVKRMD
ncbi:hypothetical protein S245_050284, partial [Arachis hypogaea]